MQIKPVKFLIAALALLSVVYTAGSYYVGFRADEHIRHMVKQAQDESQGQLLVTSMSTHAGVFNSSGEVMLAMPEVNVQDEKAVEFRLQYHIDHALVWSRLARFDWSVKPQAALARLLGDVYERTPSLNGQGSVDWAGEAITSIAFPGVKEADLDGQQLNLSDLTGTLQVASNAMDLVLNVPSLQLTHPSAGQTTTITNLSYRASSPDTRNGSVTLSLSADQLQRIDPVGLPMQISDFRWLVDVKVSDGLVGLETRQTASAVSAFNSSVNDLEIGFGIDGLHSDDLTRLSQWLDQIDGDLSDMNVEQLNEGQDLLLGMLARGLTLRIPAVKGDLKLMGESSEQTVGLERFVLSARVLDTATGAGTLSAELDALTVPEVLQSLVPDVKGFKLAVTNRVQDGRTDLQIEHELARYQQHHQSLQDIRLAFQLVGLTPEQLGVVGEILRGIDGDVGRLSQAQTKQLQDIFHDAATHGLRLSVPVAQLKMNTPAGRDTFNLEGFDVDVKLDDPAKGAGQAQVTVAQLKASGPQMGQMPQIQGLTLSAQNRVVDGVVNYQARATLSRFEDAMTKLGKSSVSMTLSGLAATDMQRLSELVSGLEHGLSTAEQNELTQIARRSIDSGFKWDIPTFDVNIDSAHVQGQASLALKGLGSKPLAAFDVARLAKLKADLSVAGQTSALHGLIVQGQAMGLLTTETDKATGSLVFDNGQLRINGHAVPVRQYVMMANAMIQSAVASSGRDKDAKPNAALKSNSRSRRGTTGADPDS